MSESIVLPSHALPRWVVAIQDHVLLSALILAEAYLLGTLMTLGWVPAIENLHTWGYFHGAGVVLFFAAGATAAGVALRCSLTAAAAFQRKQIGLALFNLLGVLSFSCAEIWASLSERSTHLAPTPADTAVLNLLHLTGLPVSPTVVIIAVLLPFSTLYWGFSQRPPEVIESAEARVEREARELAMARHKARLTAVKLAGRRQAIAAAMGKVNPLEEPPFIAANGPDTGDVPPDEPLSFPARNTTRKRGLHTVRAGQWTATDLRTYGKAAHGVTLSEGEATRVMATLSGGKRLPVQGQPYAAHKATVKAWLDRTYGSGHAAAMSA